MGLRYIRSRLSCCQIALYMQSCQTKAAVDYTAQHKPKSYLTMKKYLPDPHYLRVVPLEGVNICYDGDLEKGATLNLSRADVRVNIRPGVE